MENKSMKSVIIDNWGSKPQCKEVEIPVPKSGQVLIKVMAAAMNPADNAFLKGKYSSKRTLPNSPGLEGSGIVIASGGGILAWRLKGKRVGFVTSDFSNGSWSQYVTTDAVRCIVLDNEITYENGAYSLCNPMTVMCFQDVIQSNNYKSIIQTAACSAIGKMINRHFGIQGITVINIVRKQEQVEILKQQENAKYVLNSSDNDFQEQLSKLCQELKPQCLLDCVSGELTGQILKAMPNNSTAYVYGVLSLQNVQCDTNEIIFKGKQIKGLWVTQYLKNKSLYQQYMISRQISYYLNSTLKTHVTKKFTLDQIEQALIYYKSHMSEGKCVLLPFGDSQQQLS